MVIYFERIVKNFSRYNKYTPGTEIRKLSYEIIRLIVKANSSKRKIKYLEMIREKLEELKIVLRICKEIKAFHNFNSYETGIRYVINISKQNEGWIKAEKEKEEQE